MNWYLAVLKKYAVFEGRASRTEFWMYFLVSLIITVVLHLLDRLFGTAWHHGFGGLLGAIYGFAVLLPNLGLVIRRLHDSGKSGWFALLLLVPFVGAVVVLVLMALDSEPGDNRYGPSVKDAAPPPPV